MRRNLVGSSDLHLVDQGGDFTPRTVTLGRKLTRAEKDARAQPDLEYWSALNAELQERLAALREGRDPGPRSEMLQAVSTLSVEERAEWAASSFEFWEGRVGEAEDKLAEPEQSDIVFTRLEGPCTSL